MEKCEIQLNSIDCYFFCEAYIFPWAESEMSKLPRPPMKISNCYLQGKDLKAWGSSSCGVNDRRLQLEVYAQDSRHSNSFRWIIELYFGRIKFKSCISNSNPVSGILSNFSTDFLNVQVSQIHDYYARGISTNFGYWGTAWKWIFPDTSLICLIQILKSVSLWPSSNALLTY